MKILITLFSLVLITALTAAAPKLPSMNDYKVLLNRSPFIIKKSVQKAPEVKVNTSLTLRGVAELEDGWYVVVVDRKKPDQNIILREGQPANAEGVKLVRVNQKASDYKKTTVIVSSGGRQLTITYNDADIQKSIATAKKPTTKAVVNRTSTNTRPPIPTTAKSNTTPPTSNSSSRRPRVRRTVTPPPVPRTQ
jgi:hypothetical protein